LGLHINVLQKFENIRADALAFPLIKGQRPGKVVPRVDQFLGGLLESMYNAGLLTGELWSHTPIYSAKDGPKIFLAVGVGEGPKGSGARSLGSTSVAAARQIDAVNDLAIYIPESLASKDVIREVLISASQANYEYKIRGKRKILKEITVLLDNAVEGAKSLVDEAEAISEALKLGKDIANAPPDTFNPDTAMRLLTDAFKDLDVSIKELNEKELRSLGLNAVVAVGRGSVRKPRLVIIEYKGAGPDAPNYLLVGKGVCFDSGGVNTKVGGFIDKMKFDKSGAATVIAAVYAAARLGLRVNVIALAPLVENMYDGAAIKPGDIIRTYNGASVEVANTDAEGRLILADALAYGINKYDPAEVIDVATLTGGALRALGHVAAPVMGNDDSFINEIINIGETVGERMWPLPLWPEYRDYIKSEVADIKNIGPAGYASTIVGGTFLSYFVNEGVKWVHIDIAGVAFTLNGVKYPPYFSKGATGYGIRTLIEYLMKRSTQTSRF
jgi:leucyl aminopeptidase